MDYARYEIGTRRDDKGEPLFLADGKILGTVKEVKALIARYERLSADEGIDNGS